MRTIEKFAATEGIKGQVITALMPKIETMTENIKNAIAAAQIKKTGKVVELTAYDIDMIELGLVIDLMKAMQNYILDTDELLAFTAYEGSKGIEIAAGIKRDGKAYNFTTEAILAGGYNIQRLHYRYIVHTDMFKIKSDLAADMIAEQKKLTKIQKMKADFADMIARRNEKFAKVEEAKKMTDADIEKIVRQNEDSNWYWTITFDNIDKERMNEEEFNAMITEGKKRQIDNWKTYKIEFPESEIKSMNKSINKLSDKIEQLSY